MEYTDARRFVYKQASATHTEFIEFWEQRYKDPLEHLYVNNIDSLHTDDTLDKLFHWKGSNQNYKRNRKSVERNFISQRGTAESLPVDITALDFLNTFCQGGVIHRIFWLHCWRPNQFPIYDQHVHRAMIYIEEGRIEELGKRTDKAKIDVYLRRYLAFFKPFGDAQLPFDPSRDGIQHRRADRALLAFGKHLKDRVT